uniref:Uncharacterized protein n=1 Tax=Aegilops tauschii TaxID=37682 RepID=N1QVD5_AEGTA
MSMVDGDASGRLESILTDSSVPLARRAWAAAIELGMLARLAAPAVVVYMINYLMSMSTQVLCGRLGTLEFAGAPKSPPRASPASVVSNSSPIIAPTTVLK